MSFKPFFRHFQDSSVLWSWAFNGVRTASGIILLPLLLLKLSKADLGMFYTFGAITQLVPIVDFGFAVSVGRFVSYAMGGAEDIKAHGMGAKTTTTTPNYQLLWHLLFTTRRLYSWLSLIALILAGLFGTAMVGMAIEETTSPELTWVAWVITLSSMVLEVYLGWWNTFLMGMNEVFYSARLGTLVNILKLILASVLLFAGVGLLALPIATLVSSTLLRYAARRRCYQLLHCHSAPKSFETKHLLEKLWPNSWRVGIQVLSSYLRNAVTLFICTKAFNLESTGTFGLSLTIVAMIQSLSCVWTQVKWPAVGQHLMRHDYASIHSLLRPRFLMQFLTFGLISVVLIPLCPICIAWFSVTKQVMPMPWLIVLTLNSMLELHFTFWTTLMSMENRLPFLWPTVITNACSLLLALALVQFTSLKLGALVLAPLLASGVFNYWYWAIAGAANLKTTWWNFVFRTAPLCDQRLVNNRRNAGMLCP